MEDWRAKQAARASMASALQAANPGLVAVADKVDGLQAAAKNIRIELARAFPGVKFSVKSRRFSMGDAIDVRWTDGPMSVQVDAILNRYKAGSFDGMDDLYSYVHSAWKDAFGDAKYLSGQRDSSDRAIESAIRTVFQRFFCNLAAVPIPEIAQYRKGSLRLVQVPGLNADLDELIGREISRRTWAIDKTPAAPVMAAAEGVPA